MDFTNKHTVRVTSYLLFLLAATQALYTLLRMADIDFPRQLFWGTESILFTFLMAFAGAAMVRAKHYHVGWSAIAFSAALNLVQVSVGLTMFTPFREATTQNDSLGPLAGAVVALSFMIYYAAKLLLGFAALIFGIAKMQDGAKPLGGVTAVVGVVAMLANGILIVLGRNAFLPSAVAGGFGVLATLLLGVCLLSIKHHDEQ
ncbi:thiamine biosynthesis protein ThiC [Alteromonas stellipolaris]|uniref:thiamine biosynthesis protein ThiC n=1 Tax=Alteromonas stellipolaris TaxID=233316 RepID=UPI0026E22269|nr:thiamine biosynthesis protein ThiC [Alteromonas stellipolaris]MDO6540573.1 thiamine biosynthesis protein ThiC [Alteromonas stellipolaris]